jgi:2-(1,2-epoxy-1,2-dihydrophenyl)acetyl-CoA isomerase
MVDHLAHAPTMSFAASKHAIRGAWCTTLDEQLEIERALQRKCGLSEDYKEGVNAFKARRTPNFTGR